MEFLYEKSTNLLYSIAESGSCQVSIDEGRLQVVILGQEFKIDKHHSERYINEQICNLLSNVAWFSYRKHFAPILKRDTLTELTSDAGWGCMIRSGQMMLYLALVKFFAPEKFVKRLPIDSESVLILQRYFYEGISNAGFAKLSKKDKSYGNEPLSIKPADPIGVFALQNFVKVARRDFKLPEGSWFRATTFLLALKDLIKSRKELSKLRIFNCFENCFFFETLCKKAFDGFKVGECRDYQEAAKMLSEREWDNQVLFSFCTMLGIDEMNPLYKNFLKALVEIDSFVGMIGGQNQRAYFFLGYSGDMDFYYLDPHYVRKSLLTMSDVGVIKEEYFKKSYRQINFSKMSSSVSVSFLLRGRSDFAKLWETLGRLKTEYADNFFIAYFLSKRETEINDEDAIVFFD